MRMGPGNHGWSVGHDAAGARMLAHAARCRIRDLPGWIPARSGRPYPVDYSHRNQDTHHQRFQRQALPAEAVAAGRDGATEFPTHLDLLFSFGWAMWRLAADESG